MIKLGQKVRDIVTGFEGIAISRIEYLNGCIQYCIKPKVSQKEKNKAPKGHWADVDQIEVIGDGVLKKKKAVVKSKKTTGGDYSCAPNL